MPCEKQIDKRDGLNWHCCGGMWCSALGCMVSHTPHHMPGTSTLQIKWLLIQNIIICHPSLSHSLSQIALSLAIILTLRLHVVVLVFVLSFWPCVQCSYSPIFYYDLLSRYIMLLCCSSSGSKIHRHTLNLSLGWAWGKKHANWRVWTTLLAHAVQMEFCYATHVMVN